MKKFSTFYKKKRIKGCGILDSLGKICYDIDVL